jgi:hypothetical protein
MNPRPQPDQPDRLIHVHVNVTVAVPRRMWLLAAIAVGNLPLTDGLLEIASLILRASIRLVH